MSTSNPPRTLAIVGSTGFLGPHIVASLLREHPGCKIVCFNRSECGKRRTISALQEIVGDISSARERLKFLVTGITSHAREPDLDPIAVNTTGLRKVVDLLVSADGFPRITFISSICAVGDWPLRHPDRPMIPEEVIWDCGSAMRTGYGQSKCIAEQLLAKAHEVTKLHVNILRAGQIGGSTSPKHCKWPRQGWLYSIIQSSLKIGVFPKHMQPLDWIPVDVLAQGVANCMKRPRTSERLQDFNMVHPNPTSWNLLHEVLHTKFGVSAQSATLPHWLARIEQGELRIYDFLSAQGGGREANMFYENARAKEILPPIDPIDVDLLATWLRGWGLQSRAKM